MQKIQICLKFLLLHKFVYSTSAKNKTSDTSLSPEESINVLLQPLMKDSPYLSVFQYNIYKDMSINENYMFIVPFNVCNVRATFTDRISRFSKKLIDFPTDNVTTIGKCFEEAANSKTSDKWLKEFFMKTKERAHSRFDMFNLFLLKISDKHKNAGMDLTPISIFSKEEIGSCHNDVFIQIKGDFYVSLLASLDEIKSQKNRAENIFFLKLEKLTPIDEVENGLKMLSDTINNYGYFLVTARIFFEPKFRNEEYTGMSVFQSGNEFPTEHLKDRTKKIRSIHILLQRIQ